MLLKSLAAFKAGIDIFYDPRFTKTITNDWHLWVSHKGIDPRKCKHIRFAQPRGSSEYDIYLFFPNMSLPPKRKAIKASDREINIQARCYLNKEERERWVDNCLIPAMKSVYSTDRLAKHPKSFREVYMQSRARQQESVTAKERGVAEVAYILPNNQDAYVDFAVENRPLLDTLWQAILGLTRRNEDFKGA